MNGGRQAGSVHNSKKLLQVRKKKQCCYNKKDVMQKSFLKQAGNNKYYIYISHHVNKIHFFLVLLTIEFILPCCFSTQIYRLPTKCYFLIHQQV